MNLAKLIADIQNVDPEFEDRISPRRSVIKNMAQMGANVALAALPLAFGSLLNKAYGQTEADVNDVLNFALTFEYLEAWFYNQGLLQANLIPNADKAYFTAIAAHENEHVSFLKSALGSNAVPSPKFDLTAKGVFEDVLSNYDTYLAVANALEDTGVRAYKGQLVKLMGNQIILTAAMQIHSVEARHASAIRYLRMNRGVNISPWITGSATVFNDTGIAAFNANYIGENNLVQAGIDITTLKGLNGTVSSSTAVEAFDEPMDKASVLNILSLFTA
ncbi:ferritin-like domain-containing protein [Mucilaginibacter agri]|uniref:Ferritin-like domain-containing protein n=1 Tax=Mucilaginibacter agri TaxID=2695265 RepID=A0A966DTR6_9SPHI|nr:ferritin-like domain-containing protein [Mucilaginibacter agri]NCD68949.1 ferritin-like domain-containing protein [Mucilaginibacter agri]